MKKRTLLVATVMLLVAALAATGTTYAWFTESSTANASVSMGVSTGSSLEISTDNATWKSSITEFQLDGDATTWADFSTNSTALANNKYYKAIITEKTTDITGYSEDKVPAHVTIYFRSTNPGDVKFTTTSAIYALNFDATKERLVKWAQVVVDDLAATDAKATAIYSNSANSATKAINGTATTNVNGTYSTTAFSDGSVIVKMAPKAEDDGFYYGSAEFYFFIEGTETDNGDVNGIGTSARLKANLIFEQAAE